ncbi:MAG TPA: prepilin-type N-terminal cleavage/methylation domain-containing protein [Longimicrobiaceae bacterium]|nr:prepilin-type N-terminal cleavage/methylation domain-containing protein [Longimicrobiaceae bacterium]
MCSRPDPRAARGRAGFTVAEVMVALVISGILVLVVFELIRGQGSYVSLQSARQEVQQNARGALDVISGELRSIPPAGLISADSNAISFALPRAWGVVCDGTSSTEMVALFPDLPDDMFPYGTGTGLMADVSADATRSWDPAPALVGGAEVDKWDEVGDLAGSKCAALDYAGDAVRGLTLVGSGFPDPVPAGNLVFLHQLTSYDVGKSDGLWWVRRSNGLSGDDFSQQPLAGPIPDDGSLRFTYYDDTGKKIAPPGTDAALLATVGRIGIRLTTRSRSQFGGSPQFQQDSTTVHLRNR